MILYLQYELTIYRLGLICKENDVMKKTVSNK